MDFIQNCILIIILLVLVFYVVERDSRREDLLSSEHISLQRSLNFKQLMLVDLNNYEDYS